MTRIRQVKKFSQYLASVILLGSSFALAMETDPIPQHKQYNAAGYRPASEDVLKALETQQNVEKAQGRKKKIKQAITRDEVEKGIIELSQTKKGKNSGWAKENIYDQGDLGSCTANSLAFCVLQQSINNSKDCLVTLNNPEAIYPSRLAQYYNTRSIEGILNSYPNNVKEDNGASMAGSVLTADILGVVPENSNFLVTSLNQPDQQGQILYKGWGYDKPFDQQPDPLNYVFGFDWKTGGVNIGNLFGKNNVFNPYPQVSQGLHYVDITSKYRNIGLVELTKPLFLEFVKKIRLSLSRNHPFYVGVLLDDTFMSMGNNNGFFYYPSNNENAYFEQFNPVGGHAISVVGHGPYNQAKGDKTNYFKFVNSWGPNWGDEGFGYLPDTYFQSNKIAAEGFEFMVDPVKSDVDVFHQHK